MTTTILVTGATGTVSSELVRALADRPEIEIRAAVRAMPGKLASERATRVELDSARPRDQASTWRTR